MFKITGLDKIRRELDELRRRTEELSRTHSVPMSDLLTPNFLRGCSKFASFDELCSASGFKTDTQSDFEAIPDREWDAFVAENTAFRTWEAMLDAAGAEYFRRKLGF